MDKLHIVMGWSSGLYTLGAVTGTGGMYATFAGELSKISLAVMTVAFISLWLAPVAEGAEE